MNKINSLLHIKQTIIYEDSSCAIEPCLNYQSCLTSTKFQSARTKYLNSFSSIQFRPVSVQHDFSCTCPFGFTGMNVSVMCDTEINLCYSNPCGQNGVCISLESNYVCVCDADFTGRVCEINLKKSKCSEAKSLVDLDLSMTKLTRPVCRGNSVCKNLILGGFLCDKCDSSEEPSASSYYNHMCELRASNFQSDSYLVLPGIQNRLRFKIKLNFATIKTIRMMLKMTCITKDV